MFRFTGQGPRAVPEQIFQHVLEAIHNNISDSVNGIQNPSELLENVEPTEDMQCPVCLDAITTDAVKLNQCEHVFHRSCIERWFNNHTTCPVCRTNYSEEQRANNNSSPIHNPMRRRINVILPYTVTLTLMYPNNTSMETTWSSDSTILDIFIYLRRQISMEHRIYIYFDNITFSTTESFDHLSNSLRHFRIFEDQTALIRLM